MNSCDSILREPRSLTLYDRRHRHLSAIAIAVHTPEMIIINSLAGDVLVRKQSYTPSALHPLSPPPPPPRERERGARARMALTTIINSYRFQHASVAQCVCVCVDTTQATRTTATTRLRCARSSWRSPSSLSSLSLVRFSFSTRAGKNQCVSVCERVCVCAFCLLYLFACILRTYVNDRT